MNFCNMNICFFSTQHIGDVYFSQPFILNICKNNPEITFYYWSFLGHIFFENKINNLKYLENNLCIEYNNNLINGRPPEDLLNCDYLLKKLFIDNTSNTNFVFCYENINYIALNTHCSVMGSSDLCIIGLIEAFINNINIINNKFNLNINNLINTNDLLPDIKYDNINIDKFLKWKNDNVENNCIFFYNFKPRSLNYPININITIKNLATLFTNIIFIIPLFNEELHNLNNVKFCDKDFDCFYNTTCNNLLMIEKIQLFCKYIIIIPCGASWIFMNKNIDNYIDTKIYMLENDIFTKKLNNWYNYCKNNTVNIVNNINLNTLYLYIKSLE